MLLVADWDICLHGVLRPASIPFEEDNERVANDLLRRQVVRRAEEPRIIYENKNQDQGHQTEGQQVTLPLVTAICLTRNRRQWLPKAIEHFKRQTYPNKRLLIVADGETVRDLVGEDPNITLLEIEDGYTIGAKRNFACSQAVGDIICHWDDDDFSEGNRIHDQVDRLVASGRAVTGYSEMYFTDGATWWTFKRRNPFAIGTSLCYLRAWALEHPFPLKMVGEDDAFVKEAKEQKQLTSVPAGLMMVASVHPGNTSARGFHNAEERNWAVATRPEGIGSPCENLT